MIDRLRKEIRGVELLFEFDDLIGHVLHGLK